MDTRQPDPEPRRLRELRELRDLEAALADETIPCGDADAIGERIDQIREHSS